MRTLRLSLVNFPDYFAEDKGYEESNCTPNEDKKSALPDVHSYPPSRALGGVQVCQYSMVAGPGI